MDIALWESGDIEYKTLPPTDISAVSKPIYITVNIKERGYPYL